MPKQKNSLGILVLSFPKPMEDSVAISWEDYKKLTGVDLNEIFVIIYDDDNDSYGIRFRPEFSKILVIEYPENERVNLGVTANGLPKILPIVPREVDVYDDANKNATQWNYNITNESSIPGFHIIITAEKEIGFYEN